MTRKKVRLAYIANDSARKATFKKRKKGLMKKVSELSTLCGIEACAIIYSPYDSHPEIWPSPLGVQRLLAQFKKMPEMEQSKKMVNQESFLRQRISKAKEQLKKQQKDNREKEVTQVMFNGLTGKGLMNLNMVDLNDLGWLIDQNLKEINSRMDGLQKMALSQHADALPSNIAADINTGGVVKSTNGMTNVQENQEQQLQPQPLPQPQPQQQLQPQPQPPCFDHTTVDAMQRQQWFMELMNQNDQQVNFGGGDEMIMPFVGDNGHNNGLWSNAFFPWEK